MSHATLTFTLPDESPEFKLAANAGALQLVLLDVDTALRNRVKYGTKADNRLTAQQARDILHYALRERGAEWALE